MLLSVEWQCVVDVSMAVVDITCVTGDVGTLVAWFCNMIVW